MDFIHCKGCGALFSRDSHFVGSEQFYCLDCKGKVIEEKHYQDAERYKLKFTKEE